MSDDLAPAVPELLSMGASEIAIRQIVVTVADLHLEAGRAVEPTLRKVTAAAVISNPYAGRYAADLVELINSGPVLAELLARRAVAALDGAAVNSYGKAAIVGTAGELEHAAALLHPLFGQPLRDAVGGGASIIPSAKKRGAAGTAIDVPLHHKEAAFVRSHFDAVEVRVPDAPFPDEIVVVVALTSGGRPLARVGGLLAEDAVGVDGLR